MNFYFVILLPLSYNLLMWISEQQPLRLNPAEVCDVIAAVCSETSSTNANLMTVSSKLSTHGGKPSMDVAVSVLVKLVIDMYVIMHLLATVIHFVFLCLTSFYVCAWVFQPLLVKPDPPSYVYAVYIYEGWPILICMHNMERET